MYSLTNITIIGHVIFWQLVLFIIFVETLWYYHQSIIIIMSSHEQLSLMILEYITDNYYLKNLVQTKTQQKAFTKIIT